MQPEKQKSKKKVILYIVVALVVLAVIGQFAPKEDSKKENIIDSSVSTP